ncbi:hypothetical protein [Chamaesiphon sp. VAR_69_metabat_338]|uniref:hypothetical protein n=1 Tax=Chamaesiphon sp. VAR_69_metabat_338 TaxID=2964704 RepID=UPI00286E2C5A|nr:hypothetical protein [Chamaesiphon sp. VAR_69_metabat_338]
MLPAPKQKGYVTNLDLTLFGLGTALFPRVLTGLKFPSVVNFLHFLAVPLACGSVLIGSRSKDPKQLALTKRLLIGLFILLIIVCASTLINQAGLINAVLDYLLLAEPFLLILTIVCMPMTWESYHSFRAWLIRAMLINTLFAYIQKYIFHMDKLIGGEDNIKGLFIGQGSGHVIGGSVAMTFAAYYCINARNKPLWFRLGIAGLCINHVLISDTKQVLVAFLVAYLLLSFVNFQDIKRALIYLAIGIVVSGGFYWAIYNFEALDAYRTWIRPELYAADGEATLLKFATFRIVPQYFHSPLNWWLGLGPGHTVGRLGGWMLYNYWDLLSPLGATVHQASKEIWVVVGKSWLGDKSSFFSPLFGWAGIWGDLGALGLAVYFYLAILVWHYFCVTDTSKYLMMTLFVFGTIFSQLEEPGYTLIVASIIGLDWQAKRLANLKKLGIPI